MKLKTTIIGLILIGQISCSNKPDQTAIEKENELLKKEIELLKKESELKDKKSNSTTDKNEKSNTVDSWKTFNHKFGYTIQLPNYFSMGPLTASNIQYYTTDLDENIMIGVESLGEGSQTSIIKDYQTYLRTTEGITYKILKENWFVISGQNGNDIFYYKMIVKKNQTHFLMITYPKVQKDLFDNILPRISKSFE